MPEIPLSYVEWPGLNTYFDAYMTLGHGIYPGVCIITCSAQDNPIAAFGELVFHAGNKAVRFPACRVDKLEMGLDPRRGRIWQITILDRRWRWQFGEIAGWYNVRLGNLSIRDDTVKTPAELAEMCLDAMGETDYDTSEMPDKLRPEVRWDPGVNPAEALYQLAEMTACRIVPQFTNGVFDSVKIAPMGQGAALPPTDLEFNEGCDTAELPDKVGVRLGPTIFDVQLPLMPVIGTDTFSNLPVNANTLFGVNLNAAFVAHRYPPPDPDALPTYDPEKVPQPYMLWREFPPVLHYIMQRQLGVWLWIPVPEQMPTSMQPNVYPKYAMWTHQMREKLQAEALKCYQIRLPFTIPGHGEITSHDQYILETDRAVTYEDLQSGVIRRAPSFVYGSYTLPEGINSEAYWNQLHRPVNPKKPLTYQGGFSVDPENRLVRFGEPMYRNSCLEEDYVQEGFNIFTPALRWTPTAQALSASPDPATGQLYKCFFWEPAMMVLVTAIRLLDKSRTQVRYTRTTGITQAGKATTPPAGPMLTAWITQEDLQLRAEVEYKTAASDYWTNWITPKKVNLLNEKECKDNADYYLAANMQKYQTKTPQRARYPGLFPVQLDGAIEQVTYSSSNTEGAFTVACRHSEWAYGTLLPADQRRQLKEVWNYRRAKDEQDQTKLNEMRRWVYVPSASGGVFGRTPPQ